MTIGRVYTALFTATGITVQQDLFAIVSPSDAVTELMEIHLSQVSEIGDAQEEMLAITVKSGMTTAGSGGTTVTPNPLSLGDVAYGGTVRANDTTKASGGTAVSHKTWNWNIRVPLDIIDQPEACKPISPSARLTIELATTPADTMTMSGYVVFKEIGG